MDSRMTSMDARVWMSQSLEVWSWKPKRPWACNSFTNYNLHFKKIKICDLLATWALEVDSLLSDFSSIFFFQTLEFTLPLFRAKCCARVCCFWIISCISIDFLWLLNIKAWQSILSIKIYVLDSRVIKFVGVKYIRSWVDWNAFVICFGTWNQIGSFFIPIPKFCWHHYGCNHCATFLFRYVYYNNPLQFQVFNLSIWCKLHSWLYIMH
jgi:hypothetical protein